MKKLVIVLLILLFITSSIRSASALTIIRDGKSGGSCFVDYIGDTCGGGSGGISVKLNFETSMRYIHIKLSFDEDVEYLPGTEHYVRIQLFALPENWEFLHEFNYTLLEERKIEAFTSENYEIRPETPVDDIVAIFLEANVQHQQAITDEIRNLDGYIGETIEYGYNVNIAVAEHREELLNAGQVSLDVVFIVLGLSFIALKQKNKHK